MAITVPQGLSRDAAGIAAATRVRWTYIAPTLLIYWIISMFDKSNISIVIANPKFLDEMQLAGQTKVLGWLVGSLFISYGLAAPVWGWAVTRYGPRNAIMASLVIWAATCFWSGVSAKLRHAARLAHRLGRRRGGLLSGDARFGRQLVRVARARQGDVLLVDRHHDRADAHRPPGHQPDRVLRLARTILCRSASSRSFCRCRWCGFWCATSRSSIRPSTPAEADLVQAGAIENNDDAPGRILKDRRIASGATTASG